MIGSVLRDAVCLECSVVWAIAVCIWRHANACLESRNVSWGLHWLVTIGGWT